MKLTAEQIIERLTEALGYGTGYLVDEALKILAESGQEAAMAAALGFEANQ